MIPLLIGLNQSVWFDEAYSILLAEHSAADIIRLTAADVHPPVYYMILKIWMAAFGSSEIALRSMSVVFYGLFILTAGILLRKMFGAKTAVMIVPFLVLSPFLIRYGFEIRMYSLASFIGVAATYLLVRALDEPLKKRRLFLFLAYTLTITIGVYTLYLLALVWIAHFLWLLWIVYKKKKTGIIVPGLVSYTAGVVLFLPWLPVFISSAQGKTLSPVSHGAFFDNVYGVATFLYLYKPPWEVTLIDIFITLFVIYSVIFCTLKILRLSSERELKFLFLLALYFLVPLILLFIINFMKPMYLERYLSHFAFAAYAGVAAVITLAVKNEIPIARVIGCGILAVLIIGCINVGRYGNYNFQRLHKPSVNAIASKLKSCTNGDIIFADGPQIAMELMYYINDCPVYFFSKTETMGGGFAMISYSPYRVGDTSDLPEAKNVLHVFYNKPKRSLPEDFVRMSEVKIEALGIITYVYK